ncbi:MAG TPA: hypothetical protein VF778_12240 [Xanthobacteraceae bacterium]
MPTYRDEPERPRHEPEIIPPDRDSGQSSAWSPSHGFNQTRSRRIYVTRIGPLGFALLILMVGLFAGVLLLALIGAALIWIPIAVVLLVIAAVTGVLRRL